MAFFCLAFLNFLRASEVSASSSSPGQKHCWTKTSLCPGTLCQVVVKVCGTLTSGCVALPVGKSFSQSSAQTVNLRLTSEKHQDTT